MNSFLFLQSTSESPNLFFYFAYFLVVLVFVLFPFSYLVNFFERKMAADMQARIGPSLTGFRGFMQIFSDHIKLFQKKNYSSISYSEMLWMIFSAAFLYATIGLLPMGSDLIFFQSELTLLLPVFLLIVFTLTTTLLGIKQENSGSLIGAFRLGAQAVAGSFPVLICTVTVGLSVGTIGWESILEAQGAGILSWQLFSSPFLFISGLIFYLSGILMLNLPPLDSGASSRELSGGVSSPFFGRQVSLYRAARTYMLIFWTFVFVIVYLGGFEIPEGIRESLIDYSYPLYQMIELLFLLVKSFAMIALLFWQSKVNPRLRVDQINDYAWKVLSPLALIALVGQAFWMGMVVR